MEKEEYIKILELFRDGSMSASEFSQHKMPEEVECIFDVSILGKEETVVYDIERLAQVFAVDDEGDVVLLGTLCAGDDADAVAAEHAEELAGDTGVVLHVFAHDGDGGKVLHQLHRVHGTFGNLVGEFAAQDLACRFGLVGSDAE